MKIHIDSVSLSPAAYLAVSDNEVEYVNSLMSPRERLIVQMVSVNC